MAKRFTDTEKFIDPWFRRLSTKNKLLWEWLLCYCDHAGIITIDIEFVEMILGEKYDNDVLQNHFSDRVLRLSESKYFIPKFLRFQYGSLKPDSKVHASVIRRLKEEGIDFKENDSIKDIENNARFIGYPYPMDTTKEKDKAKDKDKAKVSITELVYINPPPKTAQEKTVDEIYPAAKSATVSVDEVIQLYNDTLAGVGALKHCRGLGAKALKELLNTFSRLPNTQAWVELFEAVKINPTLNGTGKTVFLGTLDWLAVEDNALKVLSGKYDIPDQRSVKGNDIDAYIKSIQLE
jgi:hypothetical protein